ncbi:hypothetical protein ACOMHN_016672 [Nucella lapillus]
MSKMEEGDLPQGMREAVKKIAGPQKEDKGENEALMHEIANETSKKEMAEFRDRTRRATNLVVFRLEEDTSKGKENGQTKDEESVQKLLGEIKGTHQPTEIRRLGKLFSGKEKDEAPQEEKDAVPQSSRFRWRWWVLMATAGFSQGFLGFNFGKKDDKEKGDPLMNVYKEAKEAFIKQDFNKAEIRYHDALRVADEMLKLKKINFKTYLYAKTNIYDNLADMALGQGDLEKAERLYKETMKGCLQQGTPKDDNAMIELSLKLSSIYAMMDRDSEAEQGLQFCIKVQEAKLSGEKTAKVAEAVSDAIKDASKAAQMEGNSLTSSDDNSKEPEDEAEKLRDTEALLGMALETYGRLLMGQRRLTEALPALEQSASIASKVFGTDKRQYIVLISDLATTHILLHNYDKAAEILNKAIETATKIKSPHLAVLYCNLGALFLRKSKLPEAEEACLKAQQLCKDSHYSIATNMSKNCLEKIAQVKSKGQ